VAVDEEGVGIDKRYWLFAARAFADIAPAQDADWFAVTVGAGVLGVPTSGLLALTLDASAAFSYPNDDAVPYAGLHTAVSLPVARGAPLPESNLLETLPHREPRPGWYLGASGGLAVPIGDSGHAPSVEATALVGNAPTLAFSAGRALRLAALARLNQFDRARCPSPGVPVHQRRYRWLPPERTARMRRRTTMDNILRFPSAVKHDAAIDAWLRAQREDLRPLVEAWFARMRQCGSDVRELMHDGCPTACVGDAAFGYVAAFKDHVNVGFFLGALLNDPARLLEGTGQRGRHVKLWAGREVDSAALARLVRAAYVDIRARLGK
jgi:hypothetical protein